MVLCIIWITNIFAFSLNLINISHLYYLLIVNIWILDNICLAKIISEHVSKWADYLHITIISSNSLSYEPCHWFQRSHKL
jgi:hypothetical protein